jgi:hypothetical protein
LVFGKVDPTIIPMDSPLVIANKSGTNPRANPSADAIKQLTRLPITMLIKEEGIVKDAVLGDVSVDEGTVVPCEG